MSEEPKPTTPAEGLRRYAWSLYGIAAEYYDRALYWLEGPSWQAAASDLDAAAKLCWHADNLVNEAQLIEGDEA